MSDLWTVMQKEIKENFFGNKKQLIGSAVGILAAAALPLFILTQFRSLPTFAAYVSAGGAALGLSLMSTFFTPMGLAGNAWAGEREHHTLESLLATRLSDRVIFWGKYLAIVVSAAATGFATGLIALLMVGITLGHWPLFFFWLILLVLATLVGTLLACLLTSLGMIFSARAPTTKEATQWLGYVFMGVFLPIPILSGLVLPRNPAMVRNLARVDWTLVGILVGVGFLILVILLTLGAERLGRRHRLIRV